MAGCRKLDLGQLPCAALWQSALQSACANEEPDMFIDEVVLAGILIVGLCVVFCAGFGYFIWKDANKSKSN